jgi:hypothetical protein
LGGIVNIYFFKKYIYLYILDVLLLVNTSLWWDRGNGGDCWPAPHGQTEQDLMYQEDQLGGIPVKLNKYGVIVVSKKMDKVSLHVMSKSVIIHLFKLCIRSGSIRLAQVGGSTRYIMSIYLQAFKINLILYILGVL